MHKYAIDLIDDFTDIDPETRLDEADFQWASTEQGARFRSPARPLQTRSARTNSISSI